jgi:prepilin-type N-terminal cleavage/methylation domain-containing protein/prepilin-type processing-associated H-X9-DG protein
MMFKREQSYKSGFTLVELLVVISIIAVLLSVLLPALNKARESARAAACCSNCNHIGLAFNLFANDNNGRLPDTYDYTGTLDQVWVATLLPYFSQKYTPDPTKENKIPFYTCLSRRVTVKIQYGVGSPMNINPMDYGVNYGGCYGVFQAAHWPGHADSHSLKIAQIKKPAEIFGLMDSAPFYYKPGNAWYSQFLIYAAYLPEVPQGLPEWRLTFDWDGDGILDSSRNVYGVWNLPYNGTGMRHQKGTNMLFMDGHSSKITAKEWTLKQHWVW